MSTAGRLIDTLKDMPADRKLFYVYWSHDDINELLEEMEQPIASDDEWDKLVNRLITDEPLSHAIWETVQDYILKLVDEREQS